MALSLKNVSKWPSFNLRYHSQFLSKCVFVTGSVKFKNLSKHQYQICEVWPFKNVFKPGPNFAYFTLKWMESLVCFVQRTFCLRPTWTIGQSGFRAICWQLSELKINFRSRVGYCDQPEAKASWYSRLPFRQFKRKHLSTARTGSSLFGRRQSVHCILDFPLKFWSDFLYSGR